MCARLGWDACSLRELGGRLREWIWELSKFTYCVSYHLWTIGRSRVESKVGGSVVEYKGESPRSYESETQNRVVFILPGLGARKIEEPTKQVVKTYYFLSMSISFKA